VFVLAAVYYDRMTQEQVALQLGVKQPRVSKLLNKALALLAAAGLPAPQERQKHRLRYYAPDALERLIEA
jgi:hypothetical protein